ncbi:MAG: ABC transporter permease [Cyclobacteriaceae bacterium]
MKKELQPPRWIYNILERFCDPFLWEGISGDLYESFLENVETKGKWKAQMTYTLQSMGFLRMKFKKKEKRLSNMKSIWLNYFLTTLRSIKKQKALFGINLIGLIMAISCSLFALVYISDELLFDTQLGDADRTYRLYKRYINIPEDVDHLTFETSGLMGPTMQEEYPEVEESMRICPWWHKVIISYDQTNISTDKIYFVDSTFFDFFDYEVVKGNSLTMLTAPSSIALSESFAKRLFDDEDPMGKVVVGFEDLNYTVTGIFKDPPRQSSLQFNALISWSTTVPGVGPLRFRWMNNWLTQGIFTFVKLAKDASPVALTEKLPEMMNRHFEERGDQYFLKLMPLERMYLHGENVRSNRGMKTGSITFVYMLGFSAFLIFLIAGVNYVNIALSRATQTRTEVGIRKVMGSSRKQLMGRFISETFFSTVTASILSLLIVVLLLPSANMLSGKELPIAAFFQPITFLALIGFVVVISLFVGLYPAFVLSSPPISTILKSSGGVVGTTGWFRKVLLTLQYAISIFLIICTAVVIRQTDFLDNKPLGFDKEQVLILDVDNEVASKIDVLENNLLSHPNILSVSTTRSTIGDGSYSTTVFPEGYNAELGTRIFGVDQEFFETYGVEAIAGRTFLKGSRADSANIIVNKAMVDFMGWDNPIGKHIRFSPESAPLPIIGVINDFHIHSLATVEIEPMILYLDLSRQWYTAVRMGNGDLKGTMNHVQDTWDKLADRTPINAFFADDWFNEQYDKERKLLKISSLYSMISIILCCLGLFGLTALLLQQRTKEISIRKVLGAPISSILSMMNRQFIIIIIISFALAAPLSYLLISGWLDQFAYKTTLNSLPFILAGGLTLLLSILIVSGLSLRSANANPSENLNTE